MKKKVFGIAFCSILLLVLVGSAGKQAAGYNNPGEGAVESNTGKTISDETTIMIDETGKKDIKENFPMEQSVIMDENLPGENDLTTKMLDE